MELEKILEVIPIRKPMLCIDEITEIIYGQTAKGFKNVTKDEPWAKGHFVGEPIFPGTLIIETMSQIGACIFYNTKNPKVLKAYLAKVNNVKFLKKVIPDCKLHIDAEFVSKAGNIVQIKTKASVNNEIVAKGELTLYFIENISS
jgi:3-hydroxyacyl-[acyl-carrier-protein] dehydratase